MSARTVKMEFSALNGGLDTFILTNISPIYRFDAGKKTSDEPIGEKVSGVLPGNFYQSLDIKLNTVNSLPGISQEDIRASCAALKPIIIRPKNCVVTAYSAEGKIAFSATAEGVEVVTTK